MKLWQKIFLSALALIILAIDITAGVLLASNHRLMIEREQGKAAEQHYYLTATIQNRMVYERLRQKKLLLTADSIDSILRSMVSSQQQDIDGIAIFRDNTEVGSYQSAPLTDTFREQVLQSEDDTPLSMILEHSEHSYILTGSPVTMQGIRYTVFTLSDISAVYDTLDSQLQFVRFVSLAFACLIGIVLILVVFHLLSPLNRINTSIRRIAAGQYKLRLPEKGGQEFRRLSQNVNKMAASIETNIEAVQALADSRKQFIDNLTHEMKTPLTSILGFADLLRIQRSITEQQRQEYAGIIVEETRRLQTLSGKLMELITTNNSRLDLEPIALEELFADISQAVAPLLHRHRQRLVCHAEDVTLSLDRVLAQSLLYNLIDNASKASPEGAEILLACTREAGRVTISVTDHGIGMQKEEICRITEPFYMVDKSRSRKAGGAGLGLALCLEIARRHGAELQIASQPGKGTTVEIVFPAGIAFSAEKEGIL